jgi:hypothetical protein
MTDQYRFSPVLQSLISEMLRMLITYEIELTAYHLVLQRAQENFIHHGIPWDMMSNVRKILKSPALAVEAEAEYAPFDALLKQLTPQNMEIALASIKRRIQAHEDLVPKE